MWKGLRSSSERPPQWSHQLEPDASNAAARRWRTAAKHHTLLQSAVAGAHPQGLRSHRAAACPRGSGILAALHTTLMVVALTGLGCMVGPVAVDTAVVAVVVAVANTVSTLVF